LMIFVYCVGWSSQFLCGLNLNPCSLPHETKWISEDRHVVSTFRRRSRRSLQECRRRHSQAAGGRI
jgi:hypothetical protein